MSPTMTLDLNAILPVAETSLQDEDCNRDFAVETLISSVRAFPIKWLSACLPFLNDPSDPHIWCQIVRIVRWILSQFLGEPKPQALPRLAAAVFALANRLMLAHP
jgi:hypothetical protein